MGKILYLSNERQFFISLPDIFLTCQNATIFIYFRFHTVGNIPVLCGPHPGHHRPDLPGQLAQEGHQPHQLAGVGSYVIELSHKNGLCHFECIICSRLYVVSVMDPGSGSCRIQFSEYVRSSIFYFKNLKTHNFENNWIKSRQEKRKLFNHYPRK